MTIRHSAIHQPEILPLPAFQDNYIWLLRVDKHAAVVDPGDAEVVEHHLAAHGLELSAILITHHHADHIGGVRALSNSRDIPVFGPAAEDIDGVTCGVIEGDQIELPELGVRFEVFEVPGHTRTHIAFYAADGGEAEQPGGILFPGDTLFSAGCGRLLGGTAEQLHASLQRLAALPGETRVYCTHEYTLANLAFARIADPDNHERDAWLAECKRLRARGQPTLPTRIALERRINPFLRTGEASVIASVGTHHGQAVPDSLSCFTAMRAWKDVFRA